MPLLGITWAGVQIPQAQLNGDELIISDDVQGLGGHVVHGLFPRSWS